ncbi:MAG: hypothetical protein E6H91_11905 [Chloroflexi bacterium]|nr:MAG: hypothetical protein E6H91_11905 [Chloroflexota bacterium]
MDALTGAGIALATFLLTSFVQLWRDRAAENRAIRAEKRADQRNLRDAKLARLRRAFETVLIATWGVRSATSQFIYSIGDARANAAKILSESIVGINEARAQLMLEGDVHDVFNELDRIRKAFNTIEFEFRDRASGQGEPEAVKQAFGDVTDGGANIERLVDAHLRRVEQSV